MFSRWFATLGRARSSPPRSVPSSSPIPGLPPRGALSSGTPGEGGPPPLAFDDGRAFQLKSLWEILRALFVFQFCSYPRLVNNSDKLMSISRKLMGKWLFDRVMKASAYGQFVAGENLPEIQRSLENLSRLGIRPMLAVPIEEDVGNQK
ncbi:hydroxyproline dehydrogenase-like, partial [Heterodontus francisci]|uniref:hydroxyproline dehydrogenase-like n=1 Tax=Heterodontus francisci TaxID=7792 RepID=UPI00355C895A